MSAQLGPEYTQPGTGKFEGQLSQALTFNKQPPSVDGVSAGILCAMEQGIWPNVLRLVGLLGKDLKVRIVNNSNSKIHRI